MDDFNKEISNWDSNDVLKWLSYLNLGFLSETFQNNQITGYDLCLLTKDELKSDLGISNSHYRNLILKSVKVELLHQCKF